MERATERHRQRLFQAASIGTLPGENFVHPTLGAVIALVILRRRGGPPRRILVPMASASLGAILAHHAVKIVYRRRRPEIALRRGKMEPAFPSGHTADATAVLATGAYLLVREGILSPPFATSLAAALALGTGVSRVALGWHWSTDVVGGWITGVGVASMCMAEYDRQVRAESRAARPIRRRAR